MKVKGTVGAAASTVLLSLSTSLPLPLVKAVEYLEPNVQRLIKVLPASICKQLIELGEKSGFLVEKESIDVDEQNDPSEKFVPSQTIDVYVKGWNEPGLTIPDGGHTINIDDEAIWDLLQPWIPKITQIVKDNRNKEAFSKLYPDEADREPELNWIFFRKYSPNDERNSLKHHVDTNMNTVNIELADDYEGGGLFYIKPLASTGEISDEYYDDYSNYAWVNSLQRENTTEIVFPDLHTGDAIFYNYTVRHGVAPVDSGTRYSMAFFFDMDNPAAAHEDDSEDYLAEDGFKAELHNGLPDVELDLMRVYDAVEEKEVWKMVFDKVTPGETVIYNAYEGDLLLALRAGTDEVVVSGIEIKRDQYMYTIPPIESIGAEL